MHNSTRPFRWYEATETHNTIGNYSKIYLARFFPLACFSRPFSRGSAFSLLFFIFVPFCFDFFSYFFFFFFVWFRSFSVSADRDRATVVTTAARDASRYTLRGCLRADRCRPDSSDNGRDILKNWGQRCEQRQRNASSSSVFLLPLFFHRCTTTSVGSAKKAGKNATKQNNKKREPTWNNVHRFTINTLDISNFELRANIRKRATPFSEQTTRLYKAFTSLNELYDEIS